jgi:hypothetical protein
LRQEEAAFAQDGEDIVAEIGRGIDPEGGRSPHLHHFFSIVKVQPDFGIAAMVEADVAKAKEHFLVGEIMRDVDMHAVGGPFRRDESVRNALWLAAARIVFFNFFGNTGSTAILAIAVMAVMAVTVITVLNTV